MARTEISTYLVELTDFRPVVARSLRQRPKHRRRTKPKDKALRLNVLVHHKVRWDPLLRVVLLAGSVAS